MGICQKQPKCTNYNKKAVNEDNKIVDACETKLKRYNYNKKVINENNTIVDAFEIKGIKFTKIEKCICKIIRKIKVGTGFFCDIPEKNIKLLITNNHILDEIYLDQGNKVSYMISEKEEETYNEIDLEKDRFKLTNKEMDFTVIEILKEDNIHNFLEINHEQYDMNNEIYSYQYAGGVKLGFSFGNIIVKKENLLEYNVGTKEGSSGSPILLMKNSKVIGLHKASYINPKSEKINIGIPIEILFNQISYIKCTYEIINGNETQIIKYTDGVEVNKDIESKIKILNNGKEEKLVFMKKFNKIGMNIVYFIIKGKLNNMSFIFNNCSTLKKIEFNSIKTDDVTNMKSMFQSCYNLDNVDLSNFNTSKVIYMTRMFFLCIKLKEIKGINKFNTSKVINMKEMFKSCNELEYLDLSNFDVSNAVETEGIFSECNKLKEIKGSEKFTKSVKEISKNSDEKSLKIEKEMPKNSNKKNTFFSSESHEIPFSVSNKNEVPEIHSHCYRCNTSLDAGNTLCDSCFWTFCDH